MVTFLTKIFRRDTVENRLVLAILPVIILFLLIGSYLDSQTWYNTQNLMVIFLVKILIAILLVGFIIYLLAKVLDHKLSKTKIALQKSEERFRTIFESNSSAILIIETDATVTMVNDAYLRITGYSRADVIGKSWTNLIPETERERLIGYNRLRIQQSSSIPETYEFMFQTKSGEVRAGIMSVFFDKIINQIVASFTDITDRKEMEVSLMESKEKYRKLIEIQGEGLGIVDTEERFIFTNPAAERIMGVPEGGLVGRRLSEFVIGNTADQIRNQTKLRREGNQSTYEMEFIRPDGEKRVMLVTATPSFNVMGEYESSIGVFMDITDRKNIENELKKNETELKALNATKDKLFSIIAHDLRGPIGTSADLLEVMIESYESYTSEEQLKMLEILRNSAKSTYNLLETLLNWTIVQTGNLVFKPELFNLTKCIDTTVTNLVPTALSKNITLQYEPEEEIFSYADQNMIQTVIRNLIGNAIKYTFRGGTIKVLAVNQGNATEIMVSDNGMGMDEATRKSLFASAKQSSKYGTENEKGTGLGLILCKEFIERHGGKIRVESEKGCGSKFIFDIPKIHSKSETYIQKSVDPKQNPYYFDKELILIVEDEDINYQVLCSILTSVNLNFDRASTGKEAVDKFLRNNYRLILMDVQLPEMNGWEATMKIRENDAEIPIIAVTAYASDPTRKKSMDAGCNDYVTKPVSKIKLIQIIDKHLKKERSGSLLQR